MFRGTLSGKPLYSAVAEAENLVGQPVPEAFHKANRFSCPLGPEPARGWILLRRFDLNALDLNALHTLLFQRDDDNAAVESRVWQNLVIASEPRSLDSGLDANDPLSVYLVEVADARWRCQNPTYRIALDKAYNVRAPAYQEGNYYAYSLSGGVTAWTWATMLADIWGVLTPLGDWPGLPAGVTPASAPDGWEFRGVSAYDALNMILTRIGCALKADLSQTVGQFTIVQIGAADTRVDTNLSRSVKIHDGECLPIIRGKIPYGVRVFFHRREKNYGTEQTTPSSTAQWQGNAVYHVDVTGPDSGSGDTNVFHPLWSDLPAIYDDSGSITNAAACSASAQEIADNFYRMLRSTGGSKLWQRYTGLVDLAAGSTLKGVSWVANDEGVYTEVIRHPFLFLKAESAGWCECFEDSSKLHAPEFRPAWPIYPHLLQTIKLNADTPDGSNRYDVTVQQSQPDSLTWADKETAYALNLRGIPTLSAGDRYLARLIGYSGGRPLYSFDSSAAGTPGTTVYARIVGQTYSGGKQTCLYQYVVVDAVNPQSGPLADYIDRQGTWSTTDAYERSSSTRVPIDGCVVVELLLDANGAPCFDYGEEQAVYVQGKERADSATAAPGLLKFDKVVSEDPIKFALSSPDSGSDGSEYWQLNASAAHRPTSTVFAREISGYGGIPNLNTGTGGADQPWPITKRVIRGYCPGYPHFELTETQRGDGAVPQIWTVKGKYLWAGTFDATWDLTTATVEPQSGSTSVNDPFGGMPMATGVGAVNQMITALGLVVGGPNPSDFSVVSIDADTAEITYTGDNDPHTLSIDYSNLRARQYWWYSHELDSFHIKLDSLSKDGNGFYTAGSIYAFVKDAAISADGIWGRLTSFGPAPPIKFADDTFEPETGVYYSARVYDGAVIAEPRGGNATFTDVFITNLFTTFLTVVNETVNFLTVVNVLNINNVFIEGTPVWDPANMVPVTVVTKVCEPIYYDTGSSSLTITFKPSAAKYVKVWLSAEASGGSGTATIKVDGADQTTFAKATDGVVSTQFWRLDLAATEHTIALTVTGFITTCCLLIDEEVTVERKLLKLPPGSLVGEPSCDIYRDCCNPKVIPSNDCDCTSVPTKLRATFSNVSGGGLTICDACVDGATIDIDAQRQPDGTYHWKGMGKICGSAVLLDLWCDVDHWRLKQTGPAGIFADSPESLVSCDPFEFFQPCSPTTDPDQNIGLPCVLNNSRYDIRIKPR